MRLARFKILLYRSFMTGIGKGELSTSQKMGVISILPKGDKPRQFVKKKWRPISLLHISYKILSNCLANRLKQVLTYMIHENQVGFIRGRFIGENIRQLYDTMSNLEDTKSDGFLLLVDFEKAFDSISWKFIEHVLQFFNFGNYFKKYISCLNKGFKLCVIQHSVFSTFTTRVVVAVKATLYPHIFLFCA